MTDEEKKEEKKEETAEKKTTKKAVQKTYEVILVSDNYIVYKLEEGYNAWVPKPKGKDIKVGDKIRL